MNLQDSYLEPYKNLLSSKNVSKKFCWFCQRPCYEFISICEYCIQEKFKKKKKNNKNIANKNKIEIILK